MRTIVRAVQLLFLAAGLAALGYCGFVSVETWRFQVKQSEALDRALSGDFHAAAVPAAPDTPLLGALVGQILIPRIGISTVVVEGADTPELRHAAGHIPGTASPGEPGNVGIAAHRDTFFRPLKDIRRDDSIRLITPRGAFDYRVVSTRIVDPSDTAVLRRTSASTLTLVTCYPFYFVGSAPKRFIVRAVQSPGGPERVLN